MAIRLMLKSLCLFICMYIGCDAFQIANRNIHLISLSSSRRPDVILSPTNKEFIDSLPSPLKGNDQAILMKWFCRLRGLRGIAQSDVPIETFSAKSGLSVKTVKSLLKTFILLEQTLIKSNMRLVLSVALQHVEKGLDLDDLVYEGIKGLKKAGEKYDITKGYAFSTYAYPWIKEYIRIALASSLPITLPRNVYKLLVKVRAINARLSSDFGRPPSDEELAAEMGISTDRFEIVKRAIALADRCNGGTPMISRDSVAPYDEATWEPIKDEDKGTSFLENVRSREMQPLETATDAALNSAVHTMLQSLPTEESIAILKRLEIGGGDKTKVENVLSDSLQAAYQKGIRRLRRKVVSGRILQDAVMFQQVV